MGSIGEALAELIVHARWAFNRVETNLPDEYLEIYKEDVTASEEALTSISRSMSQAESLNEVPPQVLDLLCDGVVYLLAAESVLESCPPTLHSYLRRTQSCRSECRRQTQLLVMRWFCQSDIIDLEEMLHVVFGTDGFDEDLLEDPFVAQEAIAEQLSQPDPFFLGAHVMLLRGLVLRHCTELATITDIMNHTKRVVPTAIEDSEPPQTLEDALAFWLKNIVELSVSVSPHRRILAHHQSDNSQMNSSAAELSSVTRLDDLYLHTNDGVALAIAMHHYRPDLLPQANIHMFPPLTVWQRHDNWSNVIRAAEQCDLWIGVFAEELVALGFSNLQLHVLRIIEELFLVLAMGEEINGTLNSHTTTTQQEIPADTTFVSIGNQHPDATTTSFPRSAVSGVERSLSHNNPPEFVSIELRPSSKLSFQNSSRASIQGRLEPSAEKPISRSSADSDGASETQQLSLPSKPLDESTTRQLVFNDSTTNAETLTRDCSPLSAMTKKTGTSPTSITNQTPSPNPHGQRRSREDSICGAEARKELVMRSDSGISGDERSVSPTRSGNASDSRPAHPEKSLSPLRPLPTEAHRTRRRNNPLTDSMEHFRKQRQSLLRNQFPQYTDSVIQGSRDAQGVEELLDELERFGTSVPHEHASTLAEQQDQIRSIVARLRKGIRQQEFDTVISVLKKNENHANSASPQPANDEANATVVRQLPEADASALVELGETFDGAERQLVKPAPLSGQQLARLKQKAPSDLSRKKQPTAPSRLPSLVRNNQGVILNALRHVCLPGALNKVQLSNVQQVIEADAAQQAHLLDENCEPPPSQYVILLKDEYCSAMRGLYVHRGGADVLRRLYGAGPTAIDVSPLEHDPSPAMLATHPSRIYKFDTGNKKFSVLPTMNFSQMADAITISSKLARQTGHRSGY